MKGFILLIVLLVMVFDTLPILGNDRKYSAELDTSKIKINRYIPNGYKIEQIVSGNLNGDGLSDFAIIIRKLEDRDSTFLLTLFCNQDGSCSKSLETDAIITTMYETTIEIYDTILHIKNNEPWNGTNIYFYQLRYLKDDWYCIGESSFCGDSYNNWEGSIDFISSSFNIKHTIYTSDNKSYIKELKGVAENVAPYSITRRVLSNNLPIQYNGKEYYVIGRCDLWSEEEKLKMIKE